MTSVNNICTFVITCIMITLVVFSTLGMMSLILTILYGAEVAVMIMTLFGIMLVTGAVCHVVNKFKKATKAFFDTLLN